MKKISTTNEEKKYLPYKKKVVWKIKIEAKIQQEGKT